jgi:hypothetical protein
MRYHIILSFASLLFLSNCSYENESLITEDKKRKITGIHISYHSAFRGEKSFSFNASIKDSSQIAYFVKEYLNKGHRSKMAKAVLNGSLTLHYAEGKQDIFSLAGNGGVLRDVHWFFTERNLFDILKELH